MSHSKPSGGRWPKGTSGNRAGRPSGSRNKSTLFAEGLLEGESEKLVRKAIALALKGETTALRLCLERICPPRRERLVKFSLPKIIKPQHAAAATASILEAVANGLITPGEAELLAHTVQIHTQVLQTEDLAHRVADLENVILNVSEKADRTAPYDPAASPYALDDDAACKDELDFDTEPEATAGTSDTAGMENLAGAETKSPSNGTRLEKPENGMETEGHESGMDWPKANSKLRLERRSA